MPPFRGDTDPSQSNGGMLRLELHAFYGALDQSTRLLYSTCLMCNWKVISVSHVHVGCLNYRMCKESLEKAVDIRLPFCMHILLFAGSSCLPFSFLRVPT